MTAPSAAADPFPPFHIGAIYAPTSEKEEVWVPQALRPRIPKKSHPTRHGTHHAVAPPVEKFPFRPHDNRRHDDNCRHKPNRLAAEAIATATAPAPIPTTLILPPTPPIQKTHSIVHLIPSMTTCRPLLLRLFNRSCSGCCHRCRTPSPNQLSQNIPRKNLTPRLQQPDANPSNALARPATGRTRLSSPQSGSRSYQRRRQRHRNPPHRRPH